MLLISALYYSEANFLGLLIYIKPFESVTLVCISVSYHYTKLSIKLVNVDLWNLCFGQMSTHLYYWLEDNSIIVYHLCYLYHSFSVLQEWIHVRLQVVGASLNHVKSSVVLSFAHLLCLIFFLTLLSPAKIFLLYSPTSPFSLIHMPVAWSWTCLSNNWIFCTYWNTSC